MNNTIIDRLHALVKSSTTAQLNLKAQSEFLAWVKAEGMIPYPKLTQTILESDFQTLLYASEVLNWKVSGGDSMKQLDHYLERVLNDYPSQKASAGAA